MRRHPDFSAIDKNVTAYGDKYEAVMLIDGIGRRKQRIINLLMRDMENNEVTSIL